MPIKYRINPSLNLIYYLGEGLCTGSELLAVEQEAFHDPLRRQGMGILVDIRSAEMDIHLQDIRDLIKRNRELKQQGHELEKTAIITRNSFFNMLSETFLMMAEGLPIQLNIFHTLQDAIKWLGMAEAEDEILRMSNPTST